MSYGTLAKVMKNNHASPETVRKLAQAFGGDGTNERLALEDKLLVLDGHRTPRPEGEEISEPLARLMDKVGRFNEPQLRMMVSFADFLIEAVEEGGRNEPRR